MEKTITDKIEVSFIAVQDNKSLMHLHQKQYANKIYINKLMGTCKLMLVACVR